MGILDIQAGVSGAQVAASDIRNYLAQAVSGMRTGLMAVHREVQKHGRSEIASALGSDADELHSVYQQLKSCLASIDATLDVPDLPT